MLSNDDKRALKQPFKRMFYRSNAEAGSALITNWIAARVPYDQAFDALLKTQNAEDIVFHTEKASGLAYLQEPGIRDGLPVTQHEMDGVPFWVVMPDIRHKNGRILRKELNAISALRKQAPEFGPYCIEQLDLGKQKTLVLDKKSLQLSMQLAFAGFNLKKRIVLLSIPVGGSEDLLPPKITHFRSISEQDYLKLVA